MYFFHLLLVTAGSEYIYYVSLIVISFQCLYSMNLICGRHRHDRILIFLTISVATFQFPIFNVSCEVRSYSFSTKRHDHVILMSTTLRWILSRLTLN